MEIYEQLEEYNKNIIKVKCLTIENKISQQNQILESNIESKKQFLKNDLSKVHGSNNKSLKNKNMILTEEVSDLISKYKVKVKNNKTTTRHCVELQKIQDYQSTHNITNLELIKFMDQNSYIEGKININTLKNSLIRLRILSSNECNNFINLISNYFEEENIKNEVMIKILESADSKKDEDLEDENDEETMMQLLKEYNDIKELAETCQNDYLYSNKKAMLKVSKNLFIFL
jgi:hypothetical protein